MGGAFIRNLYFRVPMGNHNNPILIVYVYVVVLLVATCTSVYKQAPHLIYLKGVLVVYVYWVVLLVSTCTPVYKQAPQQPYFSCLCLWGGALSRKLYFRVQTGTKTNLILSVYVYGVVLLVATCTSVYKQAPQQTYFTGDLVVYVYGVVPIVAACTSG